MPSAPSTASSGVPCRSSPSWRGPTPRPASSGWPGTVSTLASLELGLEDYDRDRIHGAVLTRRNGRALVRGPRR